MPTFQFAAVLPIEQRTRVGPVPVNLIVSETHTRSSIVTRAPVEGESDRAQHIVHEPRTLSITGIVSPISDSPFDQPTLRYVRPQIELPPHISSAGAAADATLAAINSQIAGVIAIQQAQNPGSALDNYNTAWARWNSFVDNKELFDYVSELGVYRSMFIESITVEKNEFEIHEFTAELIEFRTAGVTRDRWLTPDIKDDARDGASVGTRTPVVSDVDTTVTPSPDIEPATPGFAA